LELVLLLFNLLLGRKKIMGLYLNGIEYNIHKGNQMVDIEILPNTPVINNIKLTSLDDNILKDSYGVYLTVKKEGK
jgi:hypothetical protein